MCKLSNSLDSSSGNNILCIMTLKNSMELWIKHVIIVAWLNLSDFRETFKLEKSFSLKSTQVELSWVLCVFKSSTSINEREIRALVLINTLEEM